MPPSISLAVCGKRLIYLWNGFSFKTGLTHVPHDADNGSPWIPGSRSPHAQANRFAATEVSCLKGLINHDDQGLPSLISVVKALPLTMGVSMAAKY